MTSSNRNYLSARELIALAVDFEQESAEFYRNIQEYQLDESTRQLAELLEKQEWSHRKMLQEYDISDTEEYLQFPPEFSLAMPALEKENPTLEELLALAIEREIMAKEIYQNSAAQTKGSLKDLLHGLAVFEEEHESRLKSLQNNY